MQKALQGMFSLFGKTDPPQKRNGRKTRGQSLVEVAIAFPVFIMLFTGVVEFGFIINYYLSLVDATRDAARLYSNEDPFMDDPAHPGTLIDDPDFYLQTALKVRRTLDPSIDKASYRGRRIVLDPAVDDVIVSVYGATGSTITLWRDAGVYHLFPTAGSATGNYPSIFTTQDIANTRVTGAPDAGILVVEVHYNYHHVLGLPWMTTWLPNPLHLRAYSIMPIRAGEPIVP
jgi:hypothetical protein